MKRTNENIVSSFFYYMWNAGAKRNAKPYSVAWPGISGQNGAV